MKIVLEIRDEIISKLKYVLLAIFVLSSIGFVYFTQLDLVNEELVEHGRMFLLVATIFAIYMAINLGANDVANNMGPAVGSKALTLGGAIFLAVIFEAGGALIAGGDVIDTIKGDIIYSEMLGGSTELIAVMLSTLLGAALWVNIATFFKAPVSITHAIFGGLIGAGITSAGVSVVNWGKVGSIAGAWVIAILAGAFIATILFISIRKTILKKSDMGEAAKHWVPVYVGLMSGIFAIYLILKGFKKKLPDTSLEFLLDKPTAIFIGIIISILVYISLILYYKSKESRFFENNKSFVNTLFNAPLIFAVCLLSFAHGSNDVANAIGPLAAIYNETVNIGSSVGKIGVPFWIMLLGALSLSIGLAVFGGRLIKTVGNEITKLDQIKAYCVALSAAITVIIASAMSLPVSTTQIAIGGVFGIGLYREYLKRKKGKEKVIIKKSMIKGIILSWIVTLPIAGIIASITYLIIMFISK
ncbi:MAG: anion permease [Candidatus Gracilibacteria bacterium]|nr:anion permease [Candidatus Gracilibacteria bacterium]MDQ7023386.1 anion permease [Candidatus Gracilibacteria bacterium]